MDNACEFLHVGLTVSDMDRTIAFYEKYFGFAVQWRDVFPPAFIGAHPELYRQREGVYSDFAFLVSPDGIVLELFRFSEQLPAEPAVWNRPGYHHICLKVPSVPEIYGRMAADGVAFFFEPAYKGDPKNREHWVFLQDPDGNMIELQD